MNWGMKRSDNTVSYHMKIHSEKVRKVYMTSELLSPVHFVWQVKMRNLSFPTIKGDLSNPALYEGVMEICTSNKQAMSSTYKQVWHAFQYECNRVSKYIES